MLDPPGPPLGVVFDNSELSNHDELSRVPLCATKNMSWSTEKNIPTRWYVPGGRVQTTIFTVENRVGLGRVQGGSVYNNKLKTLVPPLDPPLDPNLEFKFQLELQLYLGATRKVRHVFSKF